MSNNGSNQVWENHYNNYLPSYGLNVALYTGSSDQTIVYPNSQQIQLTSINPNNDSADFTLNPASSPTGTIQINNQGLYSFTASIPTVDLTGSAQYVQGYIQLILTNLAGTQYLCTQSFYNATGFAPPTPTAYNYTTVSWSGYCYSGDTIQVSITNLGAHTLTVPHLSVPGRTTVLMQRIA